MAGLGAQPNGGLCISEGTLLMAANGTNYSAIRGVGCLRDNA